MQLNNFKFYIFKVINEGKRLQKYDVNGNLLVIKWYTNGNFFSIGLSLLSVFFLPKGFTDNFSGYTISFLGIFIGLFTNIIISLYDKSHKIMENYENKDQIEKSRTLQIKNYFIQFTGLTSYSILLALIAILFLLISLSNDFTKIDIGEFDLVRNIKEIHLVNVGYFFLVVLLFCYRASTIYFLCTFFFITIFSTTSYFTFLLSEYKSKQL